MFHAIVENNFEDSAKLKMMDMYIQNRAFKTDGAQNQTTCSDITCQVLLKNNT